MARKIFKTIDVDVDAGTHDDRLYSAALHPWRSWLRKTMLPLVRQETPWLAAMQVRTYTERQQLHRLTISIVFSFRNESEHLSSTTISCGPLILELIPSS